MITTSLRIDEKLYEKLKKIAKKDKRSINTEILYILEKYIESRIWQTKNNQL